MKSTRLGRAAAVTALCLVLAPSGASQDPVPLGHGVPKDAHLYIQGIASQAPDPGMVAFERAMHRLIESRFHDDVLELATMDLPQKKREQVRAAVSHVFGLLGRVNWHRLMAREVVFAETLAMPVAEFLMIFRAAGDGGDHVAELTSMLDGFAEMIGSSRAEVREVERRSGNMTVFSIQGLPVQIAAGSVGDAVVLSTSARQTAASMRMLQDGGRGSLLQDEGFRSALAHLPESTEGVVWVDVDGMLGFLSQALQLAAASASDDEEAGGVAFVRALLEELDVLEHVVISTVSDGTTVTATSLTKLVPDFADTRLAELFRRQQPWQDWHRFVPANATGFYFDIGIDMGGLFDLVIDLARENLAHTAWTRSGACAELRDIAGHVSGETAMVSFPRAGEKGCAMGETVCLVRLEKTEGVAEWVRAHLDACAHFVRGRGQQMDVEMMRGVDGELYMVRLEAFPWIRPVIGVRDGMLVMATSGAALEELARVGRGEAPDIRSSKRFGELGLGGGSGVYLDYAQLDTCMAGFADLMGGAGFFLSMLPEERDTRAAIKAGVVLTKLASALRELDLRYDTGADMLAGPDPTTAIGRRVYRYR